MRRPHLSVALETPKVPQNTDITAISIQQRCSVTARAAARVASKRPMAECVCAGESGLRGPPFPEHAECPQISSTPGQEGRCGGFEERKGCPDYKGSGEN